MTSRSTGFGGFLALIVGLGAAWWLSIAFGRQDAPRAPVPAPAAWTRAPYAEVALAGALSNPAVREASGLAPSRLDGGVLWVLNDSGNPPDLFAIGTNGAALATFRIGSVDNRDWEDLASFRWKGAPYLLIADTGDNDARRDECALLAVREPDLRRDPAGAGATLPVAWTVRFRYEDGPRDCEAVAVDPGAERAFLLTKRTQPPILYELPLGPPGTSGVQVARRVAAASTLPAPDTKSWRRRFWTQPSAMDMTGDGRALAVLTYEHGYLYERRPEESWAQALGRAPLRIELPPEDTGFLKQREALCFGDGIRHIFVTAEGRHAPLGRLDYQGATTRK